jgi:Rv2525c-like, glycoside hydrolase-like domain
MTHDSRFVPGRPILRGSLCAGLAILTMQAAAAAPELRAMRLVAPNAGWVLAGNHLLWTSSAGFQWTDITPPAPSSRPIYGAFFLNTSQGWVLRAGTSTTLELARTSDGGAHWSIGAFPLRAGAARFGGRADLDFIDAAHGWAMLRQTSSSNFSLGMLFATGDGGATWTPLPPPPLGDPVHFTSKTDGWIAGGPAGNRLYVTRDGGMTWASASTLLAGAQMSDSLPPAAASAATRSLAPDAAIVASDFIDGARGWVLAAQGHCTGFKTGCSQQYTLLATSDSGRTFQDITPRLVTVTPQTTETGIGEGFDQCSIGSTSAMQTWWNDSPYYYANMYIGGINRACGQPGLSPSWVNTVVAQGWRLFPTWVGPQAPCTTCSGCSTFSTNTATAARQGAGQANGASTIASRLGLTSTIVYYDMEAYNGNSSCTPAVQAFVNNWVAEMHAKGNLAGVYGSPTNANDWANLAHPPDDVWIADWNYQDTVWNIPGLSNSLWVNNQRLHQYIGGHNETYGGITFNMDNDVLEGAVTP